MARIHKASAISASSARPEIKQATIKDARKRVKKALVERAAQVATHCKVIVETLASLRKLQAEVRAVDVERYGIRGERSSEAEFSDLSGEFIVERKFISMESTAEEALSNAERLIAEDGEEEEEEAEDEDEDEEEAEDDEEEDAVIVVDD